MRIVVPREPDPREKRAPLSPEGVSKLVEAGAAVELESGTGLAAGFSDQEYREAGGTIFQDRVKAVTSADLVLRLQPPSPEEVENLREGGIHISYLDPFVRPELLQKLARRKVSAISMEMIPRITRAQKMDALSSQANLGGYVAVLVAARQSRKIFPMMTTPSGTIPPARIFIIGAGVAGLQAIATAKRLGAIVEAYDTRPTVEEQVKSVGGRFVKLDIGETGETEQGYARELTEEQLTKQQESMGKHCQRSDVVITTAQVFGRAAPRIITSEMVSQMKPGSVIVDLAVETGGNVEDSRLDEIVEKNGVKIVGLSHLPADVALDATRMYSSNLTNLILEFWDTESKRMTLPLEDEILDACLLTHQGQLRKEL